MYLGLPFGTPNEVVLKTLQLLDKGYGHTIKSRGYKVLNYVKVIQGDGINENSLKEIIDTVLDNGYSMSNVAFGMGGGMLQENTRDTCKFAQKTSSITINGERRDIFKDPITDPGKASKAGRLDLIKVNGKYQTIKLDGNRVEDSNTEMKTVFLNGKLLMEDDLETIRKRVRE